jgi:hypothetical protein
MPSAPSSTARWTGFAMTANNRARHLNALRHGHCLGGVKSPEYTSWANMISRVRSIRHSQKRRYMDRGISVCDRWLKFEHFLADMGPRPLGMTIDRINNDGNYEPGNCRWATRLQQAYNRNTSPTVGTYWIPRLHKWQAKVRIGWRSYYLGVYPTRIAAMKARTRKIQEIRSQDERKE